MIIFMQLLYITLYFLLIAQSESAASASLMVEEGQSITIFCGVSENTKNLTWQLEENNTNIDLSWCDRNGTCTNYLPLFFIATLNISLEQSSLLVVTAYRNLSKCMCVTDEGIDDTEFEVSVYVIPESTFCYLPEANNGNEIHITCNTSRVYPDLICRFGYNNSYINTNVRFISVVYPPPSLNEDPFSTTCTSLLDVTGSLPGVYGINVTMFPRLEIITKSAVVFVQVELTLKAPTVKLSNDCPQGPDVNGSYINAIYNVNATCRCELLDVGFPPSQAQWYNSSIYEIGTAGSDNTSSILDIYYNPYDLDQKYECGANTVLIANVHRITYRPLFAYGPYKVTTDLSKKSVHHFCPLNLSFITIKCIVNASQVNPEPTFSVLINTKLVVGRQRGDNTSSAYIFYYFFKPTSAGNFEVTCRAENSRFEVLYISSKAVLQVIEYQVSAPLISVTSTVIDINHPESSFEIGDHIDVTCTVTDTLSMSVKLTLECGNRRTHVNGTITTVTFNFTSHLDGQKCYCYAEYGNYCYNKSTSVTLRAKGINDETVSSSVDHITIGLASGIPVGSLVVVSIVAIVVISKRCRKNEQSERPDIDENLYIYPVSAGYNSSMSPPSYTAPRLPDDSVYDTYDQVCESSGDVTDEISGDVTDEISGDVTDEIFGDFTDEI